jgi:tryptophan synthase alpha chain
MDRIRATFERLRRSRRKALIPFIMGGDPTLAVTSQLLLTLEDAGADLVEVGVPFSDPLADGPVIQAASSRALARGVTPLRVLEAIGAVRGRLQAPILLLSYWNPILQFSGQRAAGSPGAFLQAARERGCAGLIVPDLPVEEGQPLREAARHAGVAAIFLAAPTSPLERLRAIARASQGFIYYVSVAGTTGARRHLPPALLRGVRRLKRLTAMPICVGFGISTPAQARTVASVADGVIIGSALVQSLAQASSTDRCLARARGFLAPFRRVV